LLEGPQGLFAATTDDADPRAVVAYVESDPAWLIHDVSFKPWPACRHAHPAIDAAMAIASQVPSHRIASVLVETYKSAIDFCDKPRPVTELEAKFSLQHSVAVALLRGAKQQRPMQEDFAVASLELPDIKACRSLVKVAEDSDMTHGFPRQYQARVTVTLDDGAVFAHTQQNAWGDPELPLSMDGLQAKFRELVTGAGVSADVANALLHDTLQLPTASRVSAWTATWPTLGAAS
jgi:2-methylcitrate dehydratase PrpD